MNKIIYLKGSELAFVLHKEGIYKVGKSKGEIVINDPSISRKHAELRIKNDEVFLRDCNSKYFTKYNGNNLFEDEEIKLKHGSQITFGTVTFSFCVENKIVTSSTGNLSNEEDLAIIIKELGGIYSKNWSDSCTHLTASDIRVSVKVLYAILDNKKIVTPRYWKVYLENMKNNKPLPNPLQFHPAFTESVINPKHLEYNSARNCIFTDKTFAFWERNKQKRLEGIISKAGGKSVTLEENMSEEQLLKVMDDFVVMDPEDSEIEKKYSTVFETYRSGGTRMIPTFEIALSILLCSCEENCNPHLNRSIIVFSRKSEKVDTSKLIIDKTQTQKFDEMIDWDCDDIPASFEETESTQIATVDSNADTEICGTDAWQNVQDLSTIQEEEEPGTSNSSGSAPPKKRNRVHLSSTYLNPFALLKHKSAENARPRNEFVEHSNLNLQEEMQRGNVEEDDSTATSNLQGEIRRGNVEEDDSTAASNLQGEIRRGNVEEDDSTATSNLQGEIRRENVEEDDSTATSCVEVKEENDDDDDDVIIVEEKSSQAPLCQIFKRGQRVFPESIPINFSNVKHDVSNGTWFDGKNKKYVVPANTNLDEKDKRRREKFKDSVTVVIKDLVRKERPDQEIPLKQFLIFNSNFKKFQKFPVRKSRRIIKCSKFVSD